MIALIASLLLAAQDPDYSRLEQCVALDGHVSAVSKVRISKDGRTLVTMSGEGLRAWDLGSLMPVGVLPGVYAFDLDPMGGTVAVVAKGQDKTISLHELPSLKAKGKIEVAQPAGNLQYAGGSGKILLGGSALIFVDVKTGKSAEAFKEAAGTMRAWFGPSTVGFSFPAEVRLFTLSGQAKKVLAWENTVEAGCFDPAGKYFAGSSGNSVRVWSLETAKEHFTVKDHTRFITEIAIAGKWMATASADKTVKLYDLGARKCTTTIAAHEDTVTSIAFTPDTRAIVTSGSDRTVKSWGPEKGLPVGDLGLPFDFECVAGGVDRFYFGDQRGGVREFNPVAMKWESAMKAHVGNVTAIATSRDGKTLASSGTDGMLLTWQVDGWKALVKSEGNGADPREIRFSANGKDVFLVMANDVRAWLGGTAAPKSIYRNMKGVIATYDVSPDGKTLFVVDAGFVRFVEVESGKERSVTQASNPSKPLQSAWLPDGRVLLRKEEGIIVVLDGKLGESLRIEAMSGDKPVFLQGGFAVSPNGRQLAAAAGEQVFIWELGEGRLVKSLKTRENVKAMAFTSDGRFMAGVTAGGNAVVWTVR